ncbi:MAG: sulfite exporter TauE/SafE family protein [Fimbriimonadaceae bacterium]|nr:sulfite exporter TauE/SafE family protein [Fimbriimonadaceae bacterium]
MDPARDWPKLLALVVIGAVASAINAVAGAGSLISFPALVGLGVPSLPANATNFVGLLPGRVTSFIPFWHKLATIRGQLVLLLPPTLVGAGIGAWLLRMTGDRLFEILVPPLILAAAFLLAIQPRVKAWASRNHRKVGAPTAILLQFLTSVYGGYFGAGIGIMMLATFALYMDGSLHEQNALKIVFALAISVVASGTVLASGLVDGWAALAMLVGGLAGGYWAGKWMLKLDETRLRGAIVTFGVLLAGYYAVRTYL